jgi:hypothetical protein
MKGRQMATIDFQCSICEASFREGLLNKHGKCPSCEKEYPTVKTKAEAMALNRPEINLDAEMTEDRVRQIAKQEINEALFGAKSEINKETKDNG